MKVNRPYARDYANQMQDLVNQITKLDMVVTTRLYTLCVNHPDAAITSKVDEGETVNIKAGSLVPENRSKRPISDLSFESRIMYIEAIEKWLDDQHPHQQTRIEFSKICDELDDLQSQYCNCDKRDMPIYEEDGKNWCPQCGLEV